MHAAKLRFAACSGEDSAPRTNHALAFASTIIIAPKN
jgi:hypothetical protein